MKNKIYERSAEAVAGIPDGATIMMHGFGGPGGVAQNLIRALIDHGAKNLTLIHCAPGSPKMSGRPIPDVVNPARLAANKQVKKVITTWVGTKRTFGVANALEEAVKAGEVEVELVGQGTLSARIRAGGSGIGPFYCPVGVGTILEEGKEKRVIDGREYLLEYPLRASFGFVRAFRADTYGNLIYRGSARSFNPLIAMACDVVIAEVDEMVELGQLDPEVIVTPGIFVDRIVQVGETDLGSAARRKELLERVFLNGEGSS